MHLLSGNDGLQRPLVGLQLANLGVGGRQLVGRALQPQQRVRQLLHLGRLLARLGRAVGLGGAQSLHLCREHLHLLRLLGHVGLEPRHRVARGLQGALSCRVLLLEVRRLLCLGRQLLHARLLGGELCHLRLLGGDLAPGLAEAGAGLVQLAGELGLLGVELRDASRLRLLRLCGDLGAQLHIGSDGGAQASGLRALGGRLGLQRRHAVAGGLQLRGGLLQAGERQVRHLLHLRQLRAQILHFGGRCPQALHLPEQLFHLSILRLELALDRHQRLELSRRARLPTLVPGVACRQRGRALLQPPHGGHQLALRRSFALLPSLRLAHKLAKQVGLLLQLTLQGRHCRVRQLHDTLQLPDAGLLLPQPRQLST
mmetsp:Transcript_39816/g.100981  ORF Transcript_39816/g.100981 Transcript_39816/m.100981 type:complete len:370 (-) Transcript_39816:981-2090(-)